MYEQQHKSVQERLRDQRAALEERLGQQSERQIIATMGALAKEANQWRRVGNSVGFEHLRSMVEVARRHLLLSRSDGESDKP